MALTIPERHPGDGSPAADVNALVVEVNRVGGVADGLAIEVDTKIDQNDGDARYAPLALGGKSVVRQDSIVFNVRDQRGATAGATGDGVSDDTAAVQAAITAASAVIGFFGSPVGATIFFPPGTYAFGALTGITRGMAFKGISRWSTTLLYSPTTGIMFNLGTFTATPSNLWSGTISEITFEDLSIRQSGNFVATEGSRTSVAIADNGNGAIILRRSQVSGFGYGFKGTYGSDFTYCGESTFAYCDVGAYFGPGGEQVKLKDTQFFHCREGLVVDRAPHGNVDGCHFIDSLVSDVTFEYNAASARSGNTSGVGSGYNSYAWTMNGCWHESNADGTDTRRPPRHIWTKGDTASYPQFVKAVRPYLVSGGTRASTDSFWQVSQGTRFELDGLMVNGAIPYAVSIDSGLTPLFRQRNTRAIDGATLGALWSGEGVNCVTDDDWNRTRRMSATTALLARYAVTGDTIDRLTVGADGKLSWGSGAATADATLSRTGTALLEVLGATLRTTAPSTASVAQDVFQAGSVQSVALWRLRKDAASGGGVLAAFGAWGALQQAGNAQTLASAGAVTIDASRGNLQVVTLQANATSSTITNPVDRQQMTVTWIQDATGGRSYAWPTNCKFAGGSAPSDTTVAKRTSVTFVYDLASTSWYEIFRAAAVG